MDKFAMNGVEVVYKNDALLYFKYKKFDTITIVNAGISCAYYGLPLPKLHEKCDLADKPHHYHGFGLETNDEFVFSLCHKRYPKRLNLENRKAEPNTLIQMIHKYKLGCSDLITIIRMYEMIKSTFIPEIDIIPFILNYTDKILSEKKLQPEDLPSCDARLPEILFTTISQRKQIQLKGTVYTDFPYWSFGTRWPPENEVMIGYLFVHPMFGTICFKDSAYTIGCIVVKNPLDDLREIVNKSVYFKKYCIFTEIFNPNTKVNLEYLFLNFKDIHVMDNKRKREKSEVSKFKFEMTFNLLSKSNITFSSDKGYHFWIEATNVLQENVNIRRCFLCLPAQWIKQWTFLEISYSYTLKFARELTRIRDSEYSRVNPRLQQFQLKPNNPAALIPNSDRIDLPKLPFLNGATLEDILKSTGAVSFQAVLKYRKFNPNNSSRTSTSNVPSFFGTIGEKTHILDFQVEGVKTLSLYLNNWERMVTPVGLIPGVLVNVRNVVVQRTYCKSTALTFLEVVDFKPPCEYQTARLLTEDDWGAPCCHNVYNCIPNGVLVHLVLSNFQVMKLFMKRSCSQCSYMSRQPGKLCVTCQGPMETVGDLLIVSNDNLGAVKITTRNIDVIRVLLRVKEDFWSRWLGNFELIGQYQFQRRGTYVNHALRKEQTDYVNKLNNKVIVESGLTEHKLHMLCRKLDNSRNNRQTETLWFGVKAEFDK